MNFKVKFISVIEPIRVSNKTESNFRNDNYKIEFESGIYWIQAKTGGDVVALHTNNVKYSVKETEELVKPKAVKKAA
jgi:hypothetical protein